MPGEDVVRMVVGPQLPLPARRLFAVVQQALKCTANAARQAVLAGTVEVNRKTVMRPEQQLEVGDTVTIAPRGRKVETWGYRTTPADVELRYIDDAIVVVVKPPGILTVPSPHREQNTLIHFVGKRLRAEGVAPDVFCVHRLDRDVSGLLVFARSLPIAEALRDQFAERKPARTYLALAAGTIAQERGTFRSYLATDEHLNRYSVDDPEQGELAITHYELMDHVGDASLVRVRLETGRRNQIRVHLAEAGHPLLGESRYRREQAQHRHWPFRRIALHAAELGFAHPTTGQPLQFHAKLPGEFRHFLQAMEREQQGAQRPPSRRKRRR